MLRTTTLSSLAAVVLVVACVAHLSAAEPTRFGLQTDPAYLSISWQGQPFLKYRYGDAPPKPYVRELYTPSGVQILRDSPADHVHHRSLMYGIFVNGIDFWSEQPNHGKQVSTARKGDSRELEGGLAMCRIAEQLQWNSPEGKPILAERRTIAALAGADLPATLLTWSMRLEPAAGVEKATLTGSHYDGLGARFVVSMDRVGRFLYATGEAGPVVRGTERVTRCKWCAYAAPANGKPVTVAMFDYPENQRHPAGMFTMLDPFSYLSATPNIWNNPLELPRGASLQLTYGVALWDGDVPAEKVEALYGRWVELTKRYVRP